MRQPIAHEQSVRAAKGDFVFSGGPVRGPLSGRGARKQQGRIEPTPFGFCRLPKEKFQARRGTRSLLCLKGDGRTGIIVEGKEEWAVQEG